MISSRTGSILQRLCIAFPLGLICLPAYASPNWHTVFYSASGSVRSQQIDLNSVSKLPNGLTTFQSRMEIVNPYDRSTFYNYTSTFMDCATGQLVYKGGRRKYPTATTFGGFDVFGMFCEEKSGDEMQSLSPDQIHKSEQGYSQPKTEWRSMPNF